MDGSKGVCLFNKVLGESGSMAVGPECILCSLKCIAKLLPVCPTYAFLHLGHVSLYTPDCAYM